MDTSGTVEYGAKLEHYSWEQTRGEVTCTIKQENWPKDAWDWSKPLKVQNLDIKLTLTEISVGIKGKPPLIKVSAPTATPFSVLIVARTDEPRRCCIAGAIV